MLSRRPHKKSRKGCTQCKKRHLKCDETHPACANCHDYELPCLYAQTLTPDSSQMGSHCPEASTVTAFEKALSERKNTSSVLQESLVISILPEIYNPTAAKLLHHYLTTVYDTLSTIPSQQKVWQTSVVQIAFGHQYVLRGILAMSALHIAHTEAEMAPQFILEAVKHQQAALAEFRPLVDKINDSPEILESLFISSCFLSMCAFGLPMAKQSSNLHSLTGVEDFLTCAYLVRGMTFLVERCRASVLHCAIDDLTRPGVQSKTLPIIQSEPAAELRFLSELYISCNEEPSVETLLIYQRAIQVLHEQFVQLATLSRDGDSQSPILFALMWPAIVPREYLVLLGERKPRAIVILAYYGALLYRLKFFWCFRGWGEHLVGTCSSVLGDKHKEILAWPRTIIGMDDEI